MSNAINNDIGGQMAPDGFTMPIMAQAFATATATLQQENPIDIDAGRDKPLPAITPELFTKTFLSLLRYKRPPLEVIPILLGEARRNNFEAAYCLSLNAIFSNLDYHEQLFVRDLTVAAAKDNVPEAVYIRGSSLVAHKEYHEVRRGIQMLIDAGENGVPDAYWLLVRAGIIDAQKTLVEYARKAAEGGWPPAEDGLKLGKVMALMAEQSARECCNHDLSLARAGQQSAELMAKRLSDEMQALNASSKQLIEGLQKRYEEAESRLALWNAEAVKDKHVQMLQSQKTKAEEEWLNARLEAEHAESAKVEAERRADDLARRNKYLAGLLRKNHIAFNEHESSSSSENGEPHLGLAS